MATRSAAPSRILDGTTGRNIRTSTITIRKGSRRRGALCKYGKRDCGTSVRRLHPRQRIVLRSALRHWRSGWSGLARTHSDSPPISKRIRKSRASTIPASKSHAQHRLARALFRAAGGLFAFELVAGVDCFDFLDRLNHVVTSSHLGDTRTLAIPVAHTIFWEMGAARRASMGISDSLVRVSTGIEEVEDLIADFTHALAA